jgi:predicted enzyme related to lactoylglutathione lyase
VATQQLQSTEHDQRVDYIELSVTSVPVAKQFYGAAFGWRFEDYGPDYASFADGRLNGGFAKADSVRPGGPLIVIFAVDLEATEKRVVAAGGKIVRLTFPFPGGRRFHFTDPSGNELAVWSDRTG